MGPDAEQHKLEQRIKNDFTYHPPTPEQVEKCTKLRAQAKDLAMTIALLCPASREQSLALTNLEQAIMWANAAIARNE